MIMMLHVLPKHAVEQMRRSGIGKSEIEDVLRQPDRVILQEDIKIYQASQRKNGKYYMLRVCVNENKTPNSIATAYKASKISKYYER